MDTKDRVEAAYKHLAGKHEQKLHGGQRGLQAQVSNWVEGQADMLTRSEARAGIDRIDARINDDSKGLFSSSVKGDSQRFADTYLQHYGRNIGPKKLVQLAYGARARGYNDLAEEFGQRAYDMAHTPAPAVREPSPVIREPAVSAPAISKPTSESSAPKGLARDTSGNGPHYPTVKVKLTGGDGNAFAVLGKVSSALRTAGVSKEERDAFMSEARSGDYNNLLGTAMKWVDAS